MNEATLVYADYQATTPADPRVIEAMAPFWHDTFGNPHSAEHSVGWHSARAVQEAAVAVGALIDADAEEIIFTSGCHGIQQSRAIRSGHWCSTFEESPPRQLDRA